MLEGVCGIVDSTLVVCCFGICGIVAEGKHVGLSILVAARLGIEDNTAKMFDMLSSSSEAGGCD